MQSCFKSFEYEICKDSKNNKILLVFLSKGTATENSELFTSLTRTPQQLVRNNRVLHGLYVDQNLKVV